MPTHPFHEVKVISSKSLQEPDQDDSYLLGVITVRPPITPGEGFIEAVIGKPNPTGNIVLRHLINTAVESIFIAEAHRGSANSKEADLHYVADRIGNLASLSSVAPSTLPDFLKVRAFD